MNTPSSTPPPFDPRLKSLSLGLTTLGAATAGLSLPEKAEATGTLVTGIQITDVTVSVSNSNYINIHLAPYNASSPINIVGAFTYGWNFALGFSGSLNFSGYGNSNYTYFALSGSVYAATQTVNLATLDIGFFTTGTSFLLPGSPDDSYYIGIRRTGGPTGDITGWTHLQVGSINHLQTAINFDDAGAIAIGQVPEPSAALLLAAGATGLLTARRRRKKAA
jgi:hypothetical protein